MQRRPGLAHISIQTTSKASMGSDNGKISRRTFGVTNRIWAILALFLFLVAFTQFALPTNRQRRSVSFPLSALKPKNYINSSESEPNPFHFCPLFGPGDELGVQYGSLSLSQSRLHLGSGSRIQRFIRKALLGTPVTISVIGGSVSACHGAGDDPVSSTCYPSLFFKWWNSIFPHPASELTNGAMRRTNSAYFGYCASHHIPDVTDLVIIELDVDDTPAQDVMDSFELLVRSVLKRGDQPAVIVLGHFSPQVHEAYGFNGPDHWHTVVAQFYDVPHISVRPAIYPIYMSDPAVAQQYYADPILANPSGHRILADFLIAYMQSQICTAWATATRESPDPMSPLAADAAAAEAHGLYGGVGQKKGVAPPDKKPINHAEADPAKKVPPVNHKANIPPSRINARPASDKPYREIMPFCVSANDLINPLPPSVFHGSGWYPFHPSGNVAQLQAVSYYWYSSMPTSKLRIPIQVGAGDVGVYYLKESNKEVGQGSAVECWVDNNYPGAKTIENAADVGEPTAALEIIDRNVARGSHYVECQLLGEEGYRVPDFKILGLFAI